MLYDTYEPVIGLEVHVQLQTESKIFSPDATAFGAPPNTQVDPVSLGHPGTLPVLNRNVVEYAVRLGLALDCQIAERSIFARKHYFYPDLPKGYQISQYDTPIAFDGHIDLPAPEGDADAPTRIGITRVHMEEDAGKSMHGDTATRLDHNRCGVPLLEVVSEPDLRTPREAYRFLQTLRQLVRYLNISDGNMEEGSLRCDANVSVRPRGRSQMGRRTELKNLNSMRHVEQALDFEIMRQMRALERGDTVVTQTLLWDADAGVTRPMRSKEDAHDYRYMPDPDLAPVTIDADTRQRIASALPEMPAERRTRFQNEVGLPPYDADVLTRERAIADYFEKALQHVFKRTKGGDTKAQAKVVSNIIMSHVLRVLNERVIGIGDLPISPERLAQLVYLRLQDKVSSNGVQQVFDALLERPNDSAGKIADDLDLIQVRDADAIRPVVQQIVKAHEGKAKAYRNGKNGLFGFFMGQVMRAFDGSPDPKMVRSLLKDALDA